MNTIFDTCVNEKRFNNHSNCKVIELYPSSSINAEYEHYEQTKAARSVKRHRRYRIRSRIRFAIFITFLISLIIFVAGFLGTEVSGSEETKLESYIIVAGDTLWDIATVYADKDDDIRKYVLEIRKINNVDPGALIPGTEILIPIHKVS